MRRLGRDLRLGGGPDRTPCATGVPSAVTSPASIAACALARLSKKPRSTRRRSARRRGIAGSCHGRRNSGKPNPLPMLEADLPFAGLDRRGTIMRDAASPPSSPFSPPRRRRWRRAHRSRPTKRHRRRKGHADRQARDPLERERDRRPHHDQSRRPHAGLARRALPCGRRLLGHRPVRALQGPREPRERPARPPQSRRAGGRRPAEHLCQCGRLGERRGLSSESICSWARRAEGQRRLCARHPRERGRPHRASRSAMPARASPAR